MSDTPICIFLHCKTCLNKGEPSGTHEVGIVDEKVYVWCKNCKKLVYKSEVKNIPEMKCDQHEKGRCIGYKK